MANTILLCFVNYQVFNSIFSGEDGIRFVGIAFYDTGNMVLGLTSRSDRQYTHL